MEKQESAGFWFYRRILEIIGTERVNRERERENDKRYITYILRKKIAEIPGARHHKGGLRKRKLHVTYGEQAR